MSRARLDGSDGSGIASVMVGSPFSKHALGHASESDQVGFLAPANHAGAPVLSPIVTHISVRSCAGSGKNLMEIADFLVNLFGRGGIFGHDGP